MMKKKVCLTLVSLLLVAVLSACGVVEFELGGLVGELLSYELSEEPEIATDEEWTQVFETVETPLPESLPLNDNVLVYEPIKPTGFDAQSFVQQSLYQAEQEFLSVYGYSITHQKFSENTIISRVENFNASGEDTPLLCYLPLATSFKVYTRDMFQSNETVHLDDNRSWYGALNEDLQVEGKQFAFAGVLTPMLTLKTNCIAFNADLAKQMDMDLYAYFESGEWTLDTYLEMCELVTAGPNGSRRNSSLCDNNNYYITDRYFYGSGFELFDNTTLTLANGVHGVDFDAMPRGDDSASCSSSADMLFLDALAGKVLFLHTTLADFTGLYAYSESYADQARFALGLMPYPKYDSAASYASCVNPEGVTVLSIPKAFNSFCSETVNAYAMMMAEQYDDQAEAWLDRAMPDASARDVANCLMDSVSVDIVSILLLGGYDVDCNPFKYEDFVAKHENDLLEVLYALRVALTPESYGK